MYYQKIIDLDVEIKNSNSMDKLQDLEAEIFKIRDDAFQNLIDERLIADESFNIFLRIQEDSLKRIYRKQEERDSR